MVVANKGSDTRDFVAECRHMQMTPHVAQTPREMGRAIDARGPRGTTGYAVSQTKRKRIDGRLDG
jgi:hypothetical protein